MASRGVVVGKINYVCNFDFKTLNATLDVIFLLKMPDPIVKVSWPLQLLLKGSELFCPDYMYDWKLEMK